MIKFIWLSCLLSLCLSPSTSSAQEQEKKAKRGVRFVCTAFAPGIPNTLWMAQGDNLVEVPLNTRKPGDYYPISNTGTVILGKRTDDPEKPILPLAIGSPPNQGKNFIGLLIPMPNSKKTQKLGTRYHIHFIDEGKFRFGHCYFLNLTQKPILVNIDKKRITLRKGENKIFEPGNLAQPRNVAVSIYCKFSPIRLQKENWRLITASTWRMRSTRKEFCIFYWDPAHNRPAIKALTAFKPILLEP